MANEAEGLGFEPKDITSTQDVRFSIAFHDAIDSLESDGSPQAELVLRENLARLATHFGNDELLDVSINGDTLDLLTSFRGLANAVEQVVLFEE